jgi:photosystem II stability/assembly factor-like uncharacterized protein
MAALAIAAAPILAYYSSSRMPTVCVYPFIELEYYDISEMTGIAFSPDGNRLYLSSQRGIIGTAAGGITFEVTLPLSIED